LWIAIAKLGAYILDSKEECTTRRRYWRVEPLGPRPEPSILLKNRQVWIDLWSLSSLPTKTLRYSILNATYSARP